MKTTSAAPEPPEEPTPPTVCPGHWYLPHLELKLADGSILIKPLKPVRRGTSNQVSKWTGIPKKCLRRLAQSGFIREARPGINTLFYYPAEVEEFIRATEADTDFWTPQRRREYLGKKS